MSLRGGPLAVSTVMTTASCTLTWKAVSQKPDHLREARPKAACFASRRAALAAAKTYHPGCRPVPGPRRPSGCRKPMSHTPGTQVVYSAPAVGGTLEPTRFDAAESESLLGNDHSQGKGAARQTLAIGAMARVHQLRRFADLVADYTALAAAGLGEFHHRLGCRSPGLDFGHSIDPDWLGSIASFGVNGTKSPISLIPDSIPSNQLRSKLVALRRFGTEDCDGGRVSDD